ncbi:hypothetical protein [Streptomyces sp. NRRL S-920]|uniref:hypothetical protein n=1 Tax=Streptomyces sp. NRRL S-920 TaxID=1463921 RepID=UPI00131E8585|nr:hypothetical protein [Streptomyces sp. NRRL S-920]
MDSVQLAPVEQPDGHVPGEVADFRTGFVFSGVPCRCDINGCPGAGHRFALPRRIDFRAFASLLEYVSPFGGSFPFALLFVLPDFLTPPLDDSEEIRQERRGYMRFDKADLVVKGERGRVVGKRVEDQREGGRVAVLIRCLRHGHAPFLLLLSPGAAFNDG